jgi:FMN phosphatase YigB (HAD superfamily)
MSLYGAVIERGLPPREVFRILEPQTDPGETVTRALASGLNVDFSIDDFYTDSLPCLKRLRDSGMFVGLAGNQPSTTESSLNGLPVDVCLLSGNLGVEKPDPHFFRLVQESVDIPFAEIAYVGDRLDNDILPAKNAGMMAILIRRGPWGSLHAQLPEAVRADAVIDTLDELPDALRF